MMHHIILHSTVIAYGEIKALEEVKKILARVYILPKAYLIFF